MQKWINLALCAVLLFACSDPKEKPEQTQEKVTNTVENEDQLVASEKTFMEFCLELPMNKMAESTVRTIVSDAGFNSDTQVLVNLRANPDFIEDENVYYGPISEEICEKVNGWLTKTTGLLLSGASDLSPISEFRNIESLYIQKSSIQGFLPLVRNFRLKDLDILESTIQDPTHLAFIPKLRSLSLENVKVTSIDWLSNLVTLESLSFSNLEFNDWSALKSLPALKRLTINFANFRNLFLLEEFSQLTALSLAGNDIVDLVPLSRISSLRTLELGLNKITDLMPLSFLENLSTLSLYQNAVLDVSALGRLGKLSSLSLQSNPLGTSVTRTSGNCPIDENVAPILREFCSSK